MPQQFTVTVPTSRLVDIRCALAMSFVKIAALSPYSLLLALAITSSSEENLAIVC